MRTYLAGLQAFLETNDIELRWRKIHRLLPAKVKKTGGRMWTTQDIAIMLSNVRDLRQKALIHFLAASGVRRGAIPDLKLRHLKDMPNGCKSVLVYENSIEEYTTFIHSEAAHWLEKYIEHRRHDGEYIDENSPLFRKTYQFGVQKVIPINEDLVMKSVWHAIRMSRLRNGQQKRNGRYETQTDHGFRKRFNTILKTTETIKPLLAEKMMGHTIQSIPLDETYLDPTIEQLFSEYKKAIPNLIIDDSARKQAIIDQKEKENTELQKINEKYQKILEEKENMKKRVANSIDIDDLTRKVIEKMKISDNLI